MTGIQQHSTIGNLLRKFSLSFIEKKQPVLIFGPTGVGKTLLARHLALSALKAGHSVLFTRADKMFDALKLSVLDGSHDRTLKSYLKPCLLVIYDFAIRALKRDEANVCTVSLRPRARFSDHIAGCRIDL